MLSPEARTAATAKSPGVPLGKAADKASDQQCYFNYCKSVMAAKSSLAFLLLTGNLAGQWLCFKWKSVGFDSLRGALPSRGGYWWAHVVLYLFPGEQGEQVVHREASQGCKS